MADRHPRKADEPPIQVAYDADAERSGAPPSGREESPGADPLAGGADGAPAALGWTVGLARVSM